MSSTNTAVGAPAPEQRRSIVAAMAEQYGMEAPAFEQTLMRTVMPGNATREQVAAFLVVAKEYGLNPFTRTVFAFPDKGGIRPIVSIDGWYTIINNHPKFDGFETEDHFDDKGVLAAVTCRMYRKDRGRPVVVTEYMAECRRATEPWKQWPARMLRHKAVIQAARAAFSFAGIIDPDEYEREVEATVVQPSEGARPRTAAQATAALQARRAVQAPAAEPATASVDPWASQEARDEAAPEAPQEDPPVRDVCGLPIADVGPWESFCEEAIPLGAEAKSPLKGHTWKTAAAGSKGGGRHSTLKRWVEGAAKEYAEDGRSPSVVVQKAALTLARMDTAFFDAAFGVEREPASEAPARSGGKPREPLAGEMF